MVREITDFVTENLRPHSADADRAAELLAGRLTLGEVTSALPAGLDWEGAEKKFGARHTGALHGFRWLDVLRRESTASDDQAALLWGQLVASWATYMGGRQGGPPWYSRALSERLRSIGAWRAVGSVESVVHQIDRQAPSCRLPVARQSRSTPLLGALDRVPRSASCDRFRGQHDHVPSSHQVGARGGGRSGLVLCRGCSGVRGSP